MIYVKIAKVYLAKVLRVDLLEVNKITNGNITGKKELSDEQIFYAVSDFLKGEVRRKNFIGSKFVSDPTKRSFQGKF